MPETPLNHLATTWWTYVAHASWQATVVGLLVILIVRLGRRRSSPLRYWLLLLALGKFALPPMLFAPQGMFGFLVPPPAIDALRPDAVQANWSALQEALRRPFPPRPPDRVRAADVLPTAGDIAQLGRMSMWQELLGLLPLLHLLGGLTLALLIVRRVAHSAGARGSGSLVEYGELHRRFRDVQNRLGLRRMAQLRLSRENRVPTASGVLRPVVTISPALVRRLSPEELDLVLCHELAHHRRGDIFVGWLQLVLCCAWWFNPVVWLLSGEIRKTREECCDDLVLSLERMSLSAYCQTLLHAVRGATGQPPAATALGLTDRLPPLGHRMRRILDPSLRRRTKLSAPAGLTIVLTAALLLPGSDAGDHSDQRVTSERTAHAAPPTDRSPGNPSPSPIEVVPRRPFQWTTHVRDGSQCEALVRELRNALLAKRVEPERLACQDGHLRIDDIETYAMLQSLLAKHGLIQDRHLELAVRVFTIDSTRLPEIGVRWRFMTHTDQANDIVQYVTLSSAQARTLCQRLSQNSLATVVAAPRLELANGQRGRVKVALPGQGRPVSEPRIGLTETNQSYDVCPYQDEDGALTVNVTGSYCATSLLEQAPPKPSHIDVQFHLSSDGTVLFTSHQSGTEAEQIHLVMLGVDMARSSRAKR